MASHVRLTVTAKAADVESERDMVTGARRRRGERSGEEGVAQGREGRGGDGGWQCERGGGCDAAGSHAPRVPISLSPSSPSTLHSPNSALLAPRHRHRVRGGALEACGCVLQSLRLTTDKIAFEAVPTDAEFPTSNQLVRLWLDKHEGLRASDSTQESDLQLTSNHTTLGAVPAHVLVGPMGPAPSVDVLDPAWRHKAVEP
ncbi:unnamed protein product [Closterium sp. Yama58-4]|nr:unnamed protein product [Closterium sp. Yama58-4]